MWKRIESPAKRIVPKPILRILLPFYNRIVPKHASELAYWTKVFAAENGRFYNAHYQRIMLALAEEPDDRFLAGKVVADFGCGPRGSLTWANSASLRIGIDVLANEYAAQFANNIIAQNMLYVTSAEKVIPLPSNFIDVLFTMNAMDHVEFFSTMCREILRIIKPGGVFLGSFNIGGWVTPTEPQRLDEAKIRSSLLDLLHVQSYRVSKKGPGGDIYAPILHGDLGYKPGDEGFVWVRAKKPSV